RAMEYVDFVKGEGARQQARVIQYETVTCATPHDPISSDDHSHPRVSKAPHGFEYPFEALTHRRNIRRPSPVASFHTRRVSVSITHRGGGRHRDVPANQHAGDLRHFRWICGVYIVDWEVDEFVHTQSNHPFRSGDVLRNRQMYDDAKSSAVCLVHER